MTITQDMERAKLDGETARRVEDSPDAGVGQSGSMSQDEPLICQEGCDQAANGNEECQAEHYGRRKSSVSGEHPKTNPDAVVGKSGSLQRDVQERGQEGRCQAGRGVGNNQTEHFGRSDSVESRKPDAEVGKSGSVSLTEPGRARREGAKLARREGTAELNNVDRATVRDVGMAKVTEQG